VTYQGFSATIRAAGGIDPIRACEGGPVPKGWGSKLRDRPHRGGEAERAELFRVPLGTIALGRIPGVGERLCRQPSRVRVGAPMDAAERARTRRVNAPRSDFVCRR